MKDNTKHGIVCGELRINTTNGSVCPNGHGRICPRIRPLEIRRFAEYQLTKRLNKAKAIRGFPRSYLVGGRRYVLASTKRMEIQAGFRGNVLRLKRSKRDLG